MDRPKSVTTRSPSQLFIARSSSDSPEGRQLLSIPGTKLRKYLEENLGAANISLTQEEMNTLDLDFSPGQVSGERYPAAFRR